MANIFKTVIISEEIVHLRSSSDPVDMKVPFEHAIQAEKIADVNTAELNQIKALAREEGFNQGLSDGLAQANTQMTEQVNTLNKLLHAIPTAISENRLQLSTEIADIVLAITQQFFIHQQQDKEAIAQQITQTITQLNDKQNIELSLHPDDLARLKQGQINIDLKQCKNLRVTPDESLRLGGCLVRSEHGVFDAGIERQIDSLKHVLLQMKRGDLRD